MELLSLNPGMFIWSLITFVVVAVVLKRVAWKPILDAVESREKSISDALTRSEEARAEAEKLLKQHEEKLAAAQEEMQRMLKEGKEAAEKISGDIVIKARAESEKIKERAKADIEKEREVMVVALKKDVADIVVQATAKLLNVVVDKSKHQQLIDESVAAFGDKN